MVDTKVRKLKSGLLGLVTPQVIAEVFAAESPCKETALSGTMLFLHYPTGPTVLTGRLSVSHFIETIAIAIKGLS